jgi:hypothetical protein
VYSPPLITRNNGLRAGRLQRVLKMACPQAFHWSWRIIAAAILLCALVNCGGPKRDITGKWRAAGDASAMVWEFSEDGSVKMGSMRGRYSFGDQDRVKIETPSGTSVYQLELSGDRMSLRDPNGSKLEFTKVR